MIPLTTMAPSEDNSPLHHPRRRPVEHELGYGSSACSGLHQHHRLVVRGSPRHHGQYTTAAAQDYFIAPVVRRQHVEQQTVDMVDADWKDTCWRILTCDGLCSGTPAAAAAAGGNRRSQALMVDVVSRFLFSIMFVIFNIIYWPIYLM